MAQCCVRSLPLSFCWLLPLRDDEPLRLAVALIRDLRRTVSCSRSEEGLPRGWWADIRHEEVAWWQAGWQATPAPAGPSEPKLIPIVTTAEQIDAVTLAQTYIHRWPAQENVIKDFLLPLGLDVNHGFAKTPVINSEVNKKREALEKRCANVQRFREAAREKAHRASVLATKLWKQAKGRGEEVYRVLNDRLQALEAQGVTEGTRALLSVRSSKPKRTQSWNRCGSASIVSRRKAIRRVASMNAIVANNANSCAHWKTWQPKSA